MKKELVEKIMSREESVRKEVIDMGMDTGLMFMISHTVDKGNDCLNINEIVWKSTYESFEKSLEMLEVKELTVSDHSTALIETLEFLNNIGFEMVGMTKVYTGFTDWETGEKETRPAVKLIKK